MTKNYPVKNGWFIGGEPILPGMDAFGQNVHPDDRLYVTSRYDSNSSYPIELRDAQNKEPTTKHIGLGQYIVGNFVRIEKNASSAQTSAVNPRVILRDVTIHSCSNSTLRTEPLRSEIEVSLACDGQAIFNTQEYSSAHLKPIGEQALDDFSCSVGIFSEICRGASAVEFMQNAQGRYSNSPYAKAVESAGQLYAGHCKSHDRTDAAVAVKGFLGGVYTTLGIILSGMPAEGEEFLHHQRKLSEPRQKTWASSKVDDFSVMMKNIGLKNPEAVAEWAELTAYKHMFDLASQESSESGVSYLGGFLKGVGLVLDDVARLDENDELDEAAR
jgi:hypothetical protein